MATISEPEDVEINKSILDDMVHLLWGKDIKHEVFTRWTQGLKFGDDETTALVQQFGGPCAVIVPLQAYLAKNLLFNTDGSRMAHSNSNWRQINEVDRNKLLCEAVADIFVESQSTESFTIVSYVPKEPSSPEEAGGSTCEEQGVIGESSPKKRRYSYEKFHAGLRSCHFCGRDKLVKKLSENFCSYQEEFGVLLILYSIILTKGIDQIKNEVQEPEEPLIDRIYGHGNQSLINLMLTGTAVSNVWDNDKDISGLKLPGIPKQAEIGFLTLLEHLRYCEVGWYYKNPVYPIWVLGSETHLTVLFSEDINLVSVESPEGMARRIFNNFDPEENGFVSADLLGDLLSELDLVSDPEYVNIMKDKLDPEQLGIITLNSFMEEFFPSNPKSEELQKFELYHYNGIERSNPGNKVVFQEGTAVVMELPELQIITDASPIKTCLMTKWPTVELKWKSGSIPSLN